MEKSKYLVRLQFSAIVDGENYPDAMAATAYGLKYGTLEEIKNLHVEVVRKERSASVLPKVAEAEETALANAKAEVAPEDTQPVAAADIPF